MVSRQTDWTADVVCSTLIGMPERYFDEDEHAELRVGGQHRERWRERENIQEGTPEEKRRHHFVPQMWLRGWADPETGMVEVIDVERLRAFGTATHNVMLVTDLYRVGTQVSSGHDMGPEEAFSRIEGAGTLALSAVLQGNDLDDELRYDLALLVAVQHFRVPEVIANAVPEDPHGLKPGLEAFAAEMLAAPEGPPPPEFREHGRGRSNHEIAQQLLDGFAEFAAIERGFGFWNLLDSMHHLAGRIYRRQWTTAQTRTVLLLGDDPVPTPPLGGTYFKAEGVTRCVDTPVPIGPHKLLLIGNRPNGVGAVDPREIDHYSAISNEIQLDRANRFLIGPPVGRRAQAPPG